MKPNTENPAILNLIDQFCKLYGCKWDDLCRQNRKDWLVECRYLLMHFLRKKYMLSSVLIGRLFNLDHSTVLHGVKKIQGRMETDVNFREYIERMDTLLDIKFAVDVEEVE